MERIPKIVIVENDIPLAAKLSLKLNRLGYKITGIFSRAIDAMSFIEQELPDIILLDEKLKGQLNGMESSRKLVEKNSTSIIYFNKNLKNSANLIQKSIAFQINGKKELLKKEITNSYKRIRDNSKTKSDLKNQKYTLKDRIFVRYQDSMVKISIDDIQYIEADRNYCRIYSKDRRYLLVSTLKEVDKKLPEKRFLRIHRSYIVNLSHIDEIGGTHLVVASRSLPLSKKMRTELFKHLQVI